MGLFKTAAKVAVASAVHGRVQRRQQQRWAAQDQAAELAAQEQAGVLPVAQPAAAPQVSAPVDMAARIEQLTQLASLRDAGVLSPEEFEAQKAMILG